MSKRPDLLYCQDILESGEAICAYAKGIDFDAFVMDRLRYSAVIREFEIIGEAVGKLAAELTQGLSRRPVQDIKDFRNLLAHEYFGIDLEIAWNSLHHDLPMLMWAVQKIEKEVK
ncbi:MAG: DUF86 domain-containing protein [Alphaproteobacteria bacterium]